MRRAQLAAEVLAGDQRPYSHDTCGGVTVVSGWAYSAICNPCNSGVRTRCASCGRAAPLSEFRWADTEEPLLDYHERLRPHLPPGYGRAERLKAVVIVIGLIVGGFVGGVIAVRKDFSFRGLLATALPLGVGLGFILAGLMPKGPKVDFRKYI